MESIGPDQKTYGIPSGRSSARSPCSDAVYDTKTWSLPIPVCQIANPRQRIMTAHLSLMSLPFRPAAKLRPASRGVQRLVREIENKDATIVAGSDDRHPASLVDVRDRWRSIKLCVGTLWPARQQLPRSRPCIEV